MNHEKSTIMIGVEQTIVHDGETYYWKCFYANGSYYDNENGFVMTNEKGEVDLAERFARGKERE